MTNFLFDLLSNLALLILVLILSHLCNRLIPGATFNGARIFIGLAATALLLDAALTFLVFADAQNRYGAFSAPVAFFERAGAYASASVAALLWRYAARRRRPLKRGVHGKHDVVIIHTSPYSESQLPM
ncbi:hypothetical protein PQQ51_29235 [Paraburkholderia xenovorans]|uniref:hypothetical protein n=1 Tax=Paraburkholderia xenovorans TaxID=36873 RepID=UPI0038BC8A7C